MCAHDVTINDKVALDHNTHSLERITAISLFFGGKLTKSPHIPLTLFEL